MRDFITSIVWILLLAASAWPQPTVAPATQIAENAIEQTRYTVRYDPAYVKLDYPNGDVPRERGICADVVVRAFRAVHVDLQVDVHNDMSEHFSAYPKLWGLRGPDRNIDHRRVANLMTYFQRRGLAVAISSKPQDYLPGDVVAWMLPNGRLHIGVVSTARTRFLQRLLVVHNIGEGAKQEDVLFEWKIIGHYRYKV